MHTCIVRYILNNFLALSSTEIGLYGRAFLFILLTFPFHQLCRFLRSEFQVILIYRNSTPLPKNIFSHPCASLLVASVHIGFRISFLSFSSINSNNINSDNKIILNHSLSLSTYQSCKSKSSYLLK